MYHITLGAWYPRTTLHLTEVYNLFHDGTSHLALEKDKLRGYHKALRLKFLTRQTDYFEYIHTGTEDGIDIKYYEDGLYTIGITAHTVQEGATKIEEYMDHVFNPALGYIFSLGAPTPKVLANFPIKHPIVVSMSIVSWKHFSYDKDLYGEVYSQIESQGITVYKTPTHIFIIESQSSTQSVKELIEMQIFFREFKDQLNRYLNIHRIIWEEISSIKEKKQVSATEVGMLRSKLDGYQKTIDLITNRINQMSAYIITRSKIAKATHVEAHLNNLFQYKFESLEDTHTYIKEIWKMTRDYVASAIAMIVEIQNQSTQLSIQSLQLITLANVIATLLTKMALDKIPGVTQQGIVYIVFIILAAWIINILVVQIFRRVKYSLKFPSHTQIQ